MHEATANCPAARASFTTAPFRLIRHQMSPADLFCAERAVTVRPRSTAISFRHRKADAGHLGHTAGAIGVGDGAGRPGSSYLIGHDPGGGLSMAKLRSPLVAK